MSRPCLGSIDRNSYGPRVKGGGGLRVSRVAFGVKCACSCILGAFSPTWGATCQARGGGCLMEGGKAPVYHISISMQVCFV